MGHHHAGWSRPFILGLLGGVLLGVLFAPNAGKTTRAMIRSEVVHTAAATRQMAHRAVAAARGALHRAGVAVERVTNRRASVAAGQAAGSTERCPLLSERPG